LGYGHHDHSLEAFLGSMGSLTSPESARHHVSEYMARGFACGPSYTLTPGQPTPGLSYPPASPPRSPRSAAQARPKTAPGHPDLGAERDHGGTGISTCCASTTPVGLALAPDLPWADEPSPGTLGHSAEGFLPPLSLLMPAFSLDRAPRRFTPPLRCTIDAPLPVPCGTTQLRLRA